MAIRVGAASPGVEAVLPWTDMPKMPPDGAVVEMELTEGIEFEPGSCLLEVSLPSLSFSCH